MIGGGLGGCAAALAAARAGCRVVLTEETDWIGGQLSQQAVPPDEHPWIEQMGCPASYRQLREGIRAYYRRNYPLLPAARANPHLNPGQGWVSRLCHEPRVALAAIEELLAPYRANQQLRVLLMLADGRLNKQIAHELAITEATVKAHMTVILRKLGLVRRTQAAVLAQRLMQEEALPLAVDHIMDEDPPEEEAPPAA